MLFNKIFTKKWFSHQIYMESDKGKSYYPHMLPSFPFTFDTGMTSSVLDSINIKRDPSFNFILEYYYKLSVEEDLKSTINKDQQLSFSLFFSAFWFNLI